MSCASSCSINSQNRKLYSIGCSRALAEQVIADRSRRLRAVIVPHAG
jgi:hypothetical protein